MGNNENATALAIDQTAMIEDDHYATPMVKSMADEIQMLNPEVFSVARGSEKQTINPVSIEPVPIEPKIVRRSPDEVLNPYIPSELLMDFNNMKLRYYKEDLADIYATNLDYYDNHAAPPVKGQINIWLLFQRIKYGAIRMSEETLRTPKFVDGKKNDLYDDIKISLQCVCYPATFHVRKTLKNLKKITNLMYLDIDGFATIEDRDAFKTNIIKQYSWILMCCKSLSRLGLHVVVPVDKIIDNSDYNEKYDYISNKYFEGKLDAGAKSLTRFTVIPTDHNIFINENPATLAIDLEYREFKKSTRSVKAIPLTPCAFLEKSSSHSLDTVCQDVNPVEIDLINDSTIIDLSSTIIDLDSTKSDLLNSNNVHKTDLLNDSTSCTFSEKADSTKIDIIGEDELGIRSDQGKTLKKEVIPSTCTISPTVSSDLIINEMDSGGVREKEERKVIPTSCSFLQVLTPFKETSGVERVRNTLNFKTTIDETKFTDPNEPLYYEDGVDCMKLYLGNYYKQKVIDGYRHDAIGLIGVHLIYLNSSPNQKSDIEYFLYHLNEKICTPPLTRKEVKDSFEHNWEKHTRNELDVSSFIKKKHVFWSSACTLSTNEKRKHTCTLNKTTIKAESRYKILDAIDCIHFSERKVTQANVAEASGLGVQTVKNYWHEFKPRVYISIEKYTIISVN